MRGNNSDLSAWLSEGMTPHSVSPRPGKGQASRLEPLITALSREIPFARRGLTPILVKRTLWGEQLVPGPEARSAQSAGVPLGTGPALPLALSARPGHLLSVS